MRAKKGKKHTQKMLFVFGRWGFQKKLVFVKDVLDYFSDVPHVCAWFRMEGYHET